MCNVLVQTIVSIFIFLRGSVLTQLNFKIHLIWLDEGHYSYYGPVKLQFFLAITGDQLRQVVFP